MKSLKIVLLQDSATFRIPNTSGHIISYPLPMYSTVIGFLCTATGNPQKFLSKSFSLAIYSKFQTRYIEYIWYRNLYKQYHLQRFGSIDNRIYHGEFEHIGGQSPITRDRLHNVKTIIYLLADEEAMEQIKSNLAGNVPALHLGMAEDLVVPKNVEYVYLDEKPIEYVGKVDYYSWLPPKEACYCLPSNYIEFLSRIAGVTCLVSTKYRLVKIHDVTIRDFSYIRARLFSPRGLPIEYNQPYKFLIDRTENLPLWFLKIDGGGKGV
ncbi:MAG TPA: type I-B CRISPR-associated protein Cas5 [Thermotogaceae bacterium]|nr:type I-B CRISPR-associated protein Cas5 [Thermotogaceae bacterium]